MSRKIPAKKYPKNWIKEIRKDRNLTVSELADMVGASGPYITMLENSGRRLYNDWVIKIADALHCSPTAITNGPNALQTAMNAPENALLIFFRHASPENKEKLLSQAADAAEDLTSIEKMNILGMKNQIREMIQNANPVNSKSKSKEK